MGWTDVASLTSGTVAATGRGTHSRPGWPRRGHRTAGPHAAPSQSQNGPLTTGALTVPPTPSR